MSGAIFEIISSVKIFFFTNTLYIGDVSTVEKEMKKTLVETFKKTDEEFLKEATKM